MLSDHPERRQGRRRPIRPGPTLVWAVAGILAATTPMTQAELVLSLFSGVTMTEDNDLRLKQAGGTDLTLHGVSYRTRDWESPLYYGGRIAYFLPKQSNWGS